MLAPSFHSLRILFIWVTFSLVLIACGQKGNTEKQADIPKLSDQNINAFIVTMSKDYYRTANSLTTAFNSHKKSGDGIGFTQFRNATWTPAYIKGKSHYQSVYQLNKTYINANNIEPLFQAYENLIYIGIYLKKSLLDSNAELENEALASLKQDKIAINAIAKLRK